MADRLVLPEFKRSYRSIQRGFPKPLAHLLYGFLVWLQEKYINLKVTTAVDTAIRDYEKEEVTPSPLTEGVFSSTGDDFFDEIRIQARYTLTPNNINDDGTNL